MILTYRNYVIQGSPEEIKTFIDMVDNTTIMDNTICGTMPEDVKKVYNHLLEGGKNK